MLVGRAVGANGAGWAQEAAQDSAPGCLGPYRSLLMAQTKATALLLGAGGHFGDNPSHTSIIFK